MYETPVINQRRTLEAELTEVPFLLIQIRRFAKFAIQFLSNIPKEGRPTLWEFFSIFQPTPLPEELVILDL